ncbi:unnamed protein product [Rhizophagus irregularis]|uniref:Uncharacterized protein n=1 Tax=Rhizophagus irregularis TaxID=588596 RepID=A0A916E1D0_9GLOM|nr:unnamed protein product [Rhizophagus irregularis]CAB5346442.1 unnamed protein product [Rhizophagus irregularis]
MLDIAAVLIERGHNVIMLSSGNYTPACRSCFKEACCWIYVFSLCNRRSNFLLILSLVLSYRKLYHQMFRKLDQ